MRVFPSMQTSLSILRSAFPTRNRYSAILLYLIVCYFQLYGIFSEHWFGHRFCLVRQSFFNGVATSAESVEKHPHKAGFSIPFLEKNVPISSFFNDTPTPA
jgi:hypothetical protein